MDNLWSKDKLHKIFSKDSLAMTINAHASGDASAITCSCRLCGGDSSLRDFTETYSCDGVEERYDQLLYDCFGIRVCSPDCFICDHCVRQLRNINRFRSLVYAAFVKQHSEYSSKHSQLGIGEGYSLTQTKPKDDSRTANRLKEVVKVRKRKTETIDVKRKHDESVTKKREVRRERRNNVMSSNVVVKRMNIACTMCKQRYPMLVPFDGWKEFLCSRCKKKGQTICCDKSCKLKMASSVMRERLALRSKTDLRGRSGFCCLSNRSAQLSKTEETKRVRQQKYQCSLCPKKYIVAQHLVHHMNTVHAEGHNGKFTVCSKEIINKDALVKCTPKHTGQPVYQCDVCLRTFKGKRSFQAHYLMHGK